MVKNENEEEKMKKNEKVEGRKKGLSLEIFSVSWRFVYVHTDRLITSVSRRIVYVCRLSSPGLASI